MTTSHGQLKSYVDRIERVEVELKESNEEKRLIYAEAKHDGFDVPALKAVIGRRRKDPDKLSEFESLVETYEAALGTPVATRAPARPENVTALIVPNAPGVANNAEGGMPPIPDKFRRPKASA